MEAQKEQLIAAGCVRVIEERRSAYKAGKRPGWELCKELIRSGSVTRFVVVSLSRASRRQETAEMSELCKASGVEFVALTGGCVDVSTPEGLLNVGIQDTINRFDSLIKSVRIKQGTAARRAKGATAIGRCPFGYRYDGEKPEPNPKQWKAAQQLWELLEENEYNAAKVIRQHQLDWSVPGLIRWMKNPILIGQPAYSEISVKPLITPEQFARCQRVLKSRRFHCSRAPIKTRLFSKLVICQQCNHPMTYNKSSGKFRLKCMHLKCQWYGRGLAEWKVRNQTMEALRDGVQKMVSLVETTTPPRDQQLNAEQIAAQHQLEQLLKLQATGVEGLDTAISNLRLKVRVRPMESRADWSGLAEVLMTPGVLERASDTDLRKILLELVDEILYVGDPTKVEIRLR